MEFVRPDTHIDFVKLGPVCAVISLGLVILSIGLMIVRGFNFGIDFAGGTVLQVQVPEEAGVVDEGTMRAAASVVGFPNAVIVRLGDEAERSFRINIKLSQEQRRDLSVEVLDGLSGELGVEVIPQSIASIGPRVGGEQTARGIWALVASWALILLYIWFRFDLRYAPGAVAALIHDVIITAGVFVAFGWEFNLQVLAALLVVVGYSLNDTIVIYDRIRENIGAARRYASGGRRQPEHQSDAVQDPDHLDDDARGGCRHSGSRRAGPAGLRSSVVPGCHDRHVLDRLHRQQPAHLPRASLRQPGDHASRRVVAFQGGPHGSHLHPQNEETDGCWEAGPGPTSSSWAGAMAGFSPIEIAPLMTAPSTISRLGAERSPLITPEFWTSIRSFAVMSPTTVPSTLTSFPVISPCTLP